MLYFCLYVYVYIHRQNLKLHTFDDFCISESEVINADGSVTRATSTYPASDRHCQRREGSTALCRCVVHCGGRCCAHALQSPWPAVLVPLSCPVCWSGERAARYGGGGELRRHHHHHHHHHRPPSVTPPSPTSWWWWWRWCPAAASSPSTTRPPSAGVSQSASRPKTSAWRPRGCSSARA
jgi:hypothetical protein